MDSSSDDSPRHLGLGSENLTDRRSFKPNGETVFLNMSSGYLSGKPEWAPEKGFREISQNCVDEILDTNGLGRDQIIFRITDAGDDFLALILPASRNEQVQSQEPLGWIYFNKDLGVVEITNCNARLPRKVLDIGFSTKMGNVDAAGGFGEGLKAGALALCHYGYQVEIIATSFKWRFKIGNTRARDEDGFYCCLTPFSPTDANRLSRMRRAPKTQEGPQIPTAQSNTDVSVRIGDIYKGRGNTPGEKVTRQAFERFMKELLGLNNPTQLFGSPYGSVLLDDYLQGSIYVKGLLVKSGTRQVAPGHTERKLKWGYNFSEARLNRDRNITCDGRQIAEKRAKVIDAAINLGNDGSVQVLNDYIDILRDPESRYKDADGAEDFVPRRLARSMWDLLKAKALEQNLFYYDSQNGTEAEVITKDLKKEPAPVSSRLMKLLKKHSLACTPQQRMVDQLQAAQDSNMEVTSYFATVKRLLSAALVTDPSTSDYTMQWKSGDATECNFFIWNHTPSIVINDKFGDFRRGHMELPCTLSRADAEAVKTSHFSCDHVIIHLYARFLETIRSIRQKKNSGPMDTDANLRSKVTEKLSQMPRQVQSKTGRPGEIVVTWVDKESYVASELHGLDYKCRVTLHRERTCASTKNDLLGYAPAEEDSHKGQYNAGCGCPEQLVCLKDRQALFSGLSSEEMYFPMVARTEFQAFYGEPPKSLSPVADSKQTQVQDQVAQKQACATAVRPNSETKSQGSASVPSATRKQSKTEQSGQSKQQRRLKHASDVDSNGGGVNSRNRDLTRSDKTSSNGSGSHDNSSQTRPVEGAETQTVQRSLTGADNHKPRHMTQSQLEELINLLEDQKQALIDRIEASLGSGAQGAPDLASQADKEDLEQRLAAISNELNELKQEHDNFLSAVEDVLQGIQEATESTKLEEKDAASTIPDSTQEIVQGALERSQATPIRHRTILQGVRTLKADHTTVHQNVSYISNLMQTLGVARLNLNPPAAAPSTSSKRQRSEDPADSLPQPSFKIPKITEGSDPV